MMISKAMAKRLNEQVNNEYGAFWLYQQISYQFDDMGLKVFGEYFKKQAGEEREHAERVANYLLDQGADVKLSQLAAPKSNFKTAKEMISAALEHEKKVTKDWNEISDLAVKEKDHASRAMSNWFVDEQVEEVSTMSDLLRMVELTSNEGQLLMLEGRIWRMMQDK